MQATLKYLFTLNLLLFLRIFFVLIVGGVSDIRLFKTVIIVTVYRHSVTSNTHNNTS
jgi:hypothetical protein